MAPPKVIYLGAATYDVTLKKKFDLLGETDNDNAEIILKKGVSPVTQRDTLLHEALHGIIFLSGWGYLLKHEAEEKLVRTLTPWVLALLRDNPDLIRYLLED